MSRPFLKSGLIGIVVIVMSLVLHNIFPSQAYSLMDGFFTPILAFEFVESEHEVQEIFSRTESVFRQAFIDRMNLGNRLDYVFMVLYSLFLFVFSMTCARFSKKKIYYLGALLAVIVLIADGLENVQLLGMTAHLDLGGFDSELSLLQIFTKIKWGGLALIFLILIPFFMKGGKFSKLMAVCALATVIVAILSFINRSVLNEVFAILTAVMFLMMTIFSLTFVQKRRIIIS